MLQALNKKRTVLGLWPLTDTGCLVVNGPSAAGPGHMPIHEPWEAGFGPQRATQRSHSLTFLPAAFQAWSQPVPEGLWTCQSVEACPSPEPTAGRKELGVWDSPRSPDPFPLAVRAKRCSEGFGVLAMEKQRAIGSNYRAHFRKPNVSQAPGENLQQPGRRQMSRRVRSNIPQSKLKTWSSICNRATGDTGMGC